MNSGKGSRIKMPLLQRIRLRFRRSAPESPQDPVQSPTSILDDPFHTSTSFDNLHEEEIAQEDIFLNTPTLDSAVSSGAVLNEQSELTNLVVQNSGKPEIRTPARREYIDTIQGEQNEGINIASTLETQEALHSIIKQQSLENATCTLDSIHRVKIIAGRNAGKMGTVIRETNKITYEVLVDDVGIQNIRKTSFQFVDADTGDGREQEWDQSNSKRAIPQMAHQKDGHTSSNADVLTKQYVVIEKGVNKGKSGRIIQTKGKITLVVQIDGSPDIVNVRKTSVRFLSFDTRDGNSDSIPSSRERGNSPCNPQIDAPVPVDHDQTSINDTVERNPHQKNDTSMINIIAGNYKGKKGRIISFNGRQTYKVDIVGVGIKSVRAQSIKINHISDKDFVNENPFNANDGIEWRISDSGGGETRWGSRLVTRLRAGLPDAQGEINFLSFLLEKRMQIIDVSLQQKELKTPLDTHVEQFGRHFELASARLQSDDSTGKVSGVPAPKCLRLFYALTSGSRLDAFSLSSELLKIADFASLSPHKAAARLELLSSPAYVFNDGKQKRNGLFFLRKADFIIIDDLGYVGCGFISEEKIEELCGNTKQCKKVLGIQVRLFIPSMAIFKGMLCRKRILSGPPIQLPLSMLKVPPSKFSHNDDRAALLITKNGVHPSPSSVNYYIDRMLDPAAKNPPPKSFQSKNKELSNMIIRLWQGLNVPTEVCTDYRRKGHSCFDLQHAWIVGLADPTGRIPRGHVFVTGMRNKRFAQNEVFVTRSPCLKRVDGRMLPLVHHKPDGMSDEDWLWLNNLPFGGLIFSNPKKGFKSIPEQIADGDLDGDLFFICWEGKILKHIKADSLQDIPVPEDTDALVERGKQAMDHDWLIKAQNIMLDTTFLQDIGKLTGKLYTLACKTADHSDLFIDDPDAIAFANAFIQCLDFRKHRARISLPLPLLKDIPSHLHAYLSTEHHQTDENFYK